MLGEHVLERLALGAAEGLLAEHVEDLGQRGAGAALDLTVKLDEGHAERLGRQRPERRFAAAAQANQRDAARAVGLGRRAEALGDELAHLAERLRRQALEILREQGQLDRRLRALAHEFRDRGADGAGDAAEQHDGAIALTGLELGEVALRHFRVEGQGLARHAALAAQQAHALAEFRQVGLGVADAGCGERIGHRHVHYISKHYGGSRSRKQHVLWDFCASFLFWPLPASRHGGRSSA